MAVSLSLNPMQQRAVEHVEGPMLLVAGAGSGKCVLPETRIAINGHLVPAEQIWREYGGSEVYDGEGYVSIPRRPLWVDSFDEASGCFVRKPVQAIYRQSVSEVVRTVRLSDGSTISLTKAHKLFDGVDWTNELAVGQTVAVPRRLPSGNRHVDRELAEFFGWWIGEGYDRWQQRSRTLDFTMTLGSLDELNHVRNLVDVLERRYSSRVSKKLVRYRAEKQTWSFGFTNQELTRTLFHHGFQPNRRSAEKEVPHGVMNADQEAVRAFLRAYADAEGSIHVGRQTLELVSASPLLIKQVDYLLRRFGIWGFTRPCVKHATNTEAKRRRTYHRLYISGPSLRVFGEEIGFSLQHKHQALQTAIEAHSNPNMDVLPTARLLGRLHDQTGISMKRLSGGVDYQSCTVKNLSARTYLGHVKPALMQLEQSVGVRFMGNQNAPAFTLGTPQAEAIQVTRRLLDALLERDLAYPTIVAIDEFRYDGWVYDLTIADTHNFVAENILCHNTRVITQRIAHLIRAGHAAPDEILAVTFTNKAASEMRDRLEEMLGAGHGAGPLFAKAYTLRGMWVGTFHSICGKILRFEIDRLPGTPYRSNFVIFDDTEQLSVVKSAINTLGLDDKMYTPRAMLAKISHAKSNAIDVGTFHEQARNYQAQNAARIYEYYQKELIRQNALDFDDMLLLTVRLFEGAPEVLKRYQERFRFVMVDEFQDTNQVQYRLVRLLAGSHRNLCVVGDVDQSIYSFRAADFRIILQFQQDYPDAELIKLEENYRSTQTILDAANAVIKNNTERLEKNLWTKNPQGEPITLYPALDERDEAEYVIMEIKKRRAQRPLTDFAVLYRTNAQSRALEEVFMRWGTPYKLVGGVRFYERKEIKDMLSYMRLVYNPADESAFVRVVNTPKRGIGKTTVDRVLRAAQDAEKSTIALLLDPTSVIPDLTAKTAGKLVQFARWVDSMHRLVEKLPVPDLMKRLVEESGYQQSLYDENTEEAMGRVENLQELVTVAGEFVETSDDPSLGAFLTHLMLLSDLDQAESQDQTVERVTLMTLHSAKGLEFPVVFLVGLEEGIFPHKRSLDDPTQLEEERRLAYVGITRAKEQLIVTNASRRMLYGEPQRGIPSRFLKEIPEDLTKTVDSPLLKAQQQLLRTPSDAASRVPKRQAMDVQWTQDWDMGDRQPQRQVGGRKLKAADLAVGDRVRHEKFGEGVVARILGAGDRATIAVSFPGLGQKILDPRFAPLERIDF
ncbi:MAG: UvrD-helicase domain-containing protein [Candidatus Sericytochromatia bacterium]